MTYVDGFLLPLREDKLEEYRTIADLAGGVWREHGALEYKECVIDDPGDEQMRSFTETAAAREGETVIFAYIVYRSREHRDEVIAKVTDDPRLKNLMEGDVPFEVNRMAFAGFKVFVDH